MRTNKKYRIFMILVACAIIISSFLIVNINNGSAYADSITEIEIYQGKYDSYTDDDYFSYNGFSYSILSYTSLLYKSTSNITRSNGTNSLTITADDPIINIIPKELFTVCGDYIYIGKEYGFYVNTTEDTYYYEDENDDWVVNTSSNNKHSFVMVFNIISSTDLSQNAGVMEFSVSPIFQYEYVYINNVENQFTIADSEGYDYSDYKTRVNYNITNTNGFVIPAARVNNSNNPFYQEEERYYLKDICYSMSLLNEQELNEGNGTIYNPNNDIGSYFTYFDYRYDGLTRKNGEFPVEETVNLAEDVVGIVLGLVKCIPGAGNVVSAIETGILIGNTVYDGLQFANGIVNYVNDSNISVNNGLISATNYYANRDDQIQYYGQLMKTAGIVVNTDDNSSIWYTKGDSNTGYFQVGHSALNGQEPYYTRLQREIGLVVVDTEGYSKAQCSSYDIMLRDPNYKTVTIDEEESVYLLPNGVNYFEFDPTYTSNYLLKINTLDTLEVYFNGNLLSGSENQYNIIISAGSQNNLEIHKNGTGCITTFTISPSSNLNNINVNSNGNYLIKQDFNNDSYKKIVLSNGNLQITNIFTIENGQFINYTFDNQAIYGTDCLSIPITEGVKYFLLYNTNTTALTTNLSFENVNSLSVGSNSGNIERNWQYYKFTVPSTGSYAFSCAFINASISMGIWNANFQKLDGISSTNAIVIYDLTQNQNIWIGLRNDTLVEVNGTITANTTQNSFKWKLNGSNISGQSKSLERGTTYNLQFWINNDCQILDFEKVNGSSYFSTSANGDIIISESCPIGTNVIQIRAFADDTHEVSYTYFLNITTTYETKIKITGQLNNQTQLGFSWQTYITGITAFKYTISSSSTTERSVSVSGTSGSVDIISYVSTSVAIVDITITKITLNGTERIYNSTTAQYVNLSTRFKGGTGTEADPYLIEYPRHFNNIYKVSNSSNSNRNNIYYKQTKGLYFGNTATRSGVEFYGHYYGNVKGILEVNISSSRLVIGGLFDYNYGSISGIIASEITINSTGSGALVGSIVGINYAGGEVSGPVLATYNITAKNYSDGSTGGIAGVNYGTISVGLCGGTIISKADTGGIAGRNVGTITGGSCSANITYYHYGSTNRSIGGLVGYNNGGTINDCDFTGTVTYGGMTSSGSSLSGSSSDSRTLAPYIGILVGYNSGTLNSNCEASGTVNVGTLHTETWTTGVWPFKTTHTWNQAQYAGNRRTGYPI
ncbi:MAG: GLUG motif-containing protein [Clostridia bacterium]